VEVLKVRIKKQSPKPLGLSQCRTESPDHSLKVEEIKTRIRRSLERALSEAEAAFGSVLKEIASWS